MLTELVTNDIERRIDQLQQNDYENDQCTYNENIYYILT